MIGNIFVLLLKKEMTSVKPRYIFLSYSKTNFGIELEEKEDNLQKDRNITCSEFVTLKPKEVRTVKEHVSSKCRVKIPMKQTPNEKQDLFISKQGQSINIPDSIVKLAEPDCSQLTNNNTKRKNLQDNQKSKPLKDDLLLSIAKFKSPKISSPKISKKNGQAVNKVNAKGETPLQIACRQVSDVSVIFNRESWYRCPLSTVIINKFIWQQTFNTTINYSGH